ncbi:hypothetical protein EVAR_73724_1, partial [Eumeta japonica]
EMDQKHAMLYPDPGAMRVDERSSAAAAIGLPLNRHQLTMRPLGSHPFGLADSRYRY